MKTNQPSTWLLTLTMTIAVAALAPAAPSSTGPPDVESGYVEVEGGRIFYEAAGQGPVVVLTHDGLLHRETWNGQFAAFAETHRVVRWDRRGYGRSEAPSAPFVNSRDLAAVVSSLGVGRVSLVGCSMGSLVTLEFALEHPEKVSSLILVGPIVSGFGFSDHFRSRGDRGMPSRDAPMDQRIEYWTTIDPWATAPENVSARQAMKALMTANPHNLEGAAGFSRSPGFSALGRLSEIQAPTLIVVGESDMADVHAHSGVIQEGIEGSRRVVLTHSGHLPHFEVPDAFNPLVLEFLASVE
jgi:pimeloyl-ACP methyl ester carboxylesterase